jgi:hypothetical protein
MNEARTKAPAVRTRPSRSSPDKEQKEKPRVAAAHKVAAEEPHGGGYTLPVVHVELPGYVVEGGFWGGLVGAALVGMINPPLAVAVGAGVVIARHRRAA